MKNIIKIRFKGKDLELSPQTIVGSLLNSSESEAISTGGLVIWEHQQGLTEPDSLIKDKGSYRLLEAKSASLRTLPSVDKLLSHPRLEDLEYTHRLSAIRQVLKSLRNQILAGEILFLNIEQIIPRILETACNVTHLPDDGCIENLTSLGVILLADPFESLSKALKTLGNDGKLMIPRQQLGEVGGKRIEDYIVTAGWLPVTLGTANRCRLIDYAPSRENALIAYAWLNQDSFKLRGFVGLPDAIAVAVLAARLHIPCLIYRGCQ